jgi:hypothetical protein
MASELTVQTLRGPTSGANANTILIPSGQVLDASAGFVAPAGSVIQVVEATRTTVLSYTTNNPTFTTFVSGSITTTKPNSKIFISCNVPVYHAGNGSNWSISQYYKLFEGASVAQAYEHAGLMAGTEAAYQWHFQHLTGSKSSGTYSYSMGGALTANSGTMSVARSVSGFQTKVSLIMMEIAG